MATGSFLWPNQRISKGEIRTLRIHNFDWARPGHPREANASKANLPRLGEAASVATFARLNIIRSCSRHLAAHQLQPPPNGDMFNMRRFVRPCRVLPPCRLNAGRDLAHILHREGRQGRERADHVEEGGGKAKAGVASQENAQHLRPFFFSGGKPLFC